MVISEYFFLSEKVSSKTAFAYTDNQDIVSHELIPIVKNTLELPFDLRLKSVHSKKNKLEVSCDLSGIKYLWLDYQPNNLAWPLMSGKMRMVIEENLTGKEGITWISVKVKCKKEQRDYFILQFTKELDVINEEMTTYVPGTSHIIKPVFSAIKLSKLNLVYRPQLFWEITSSLYVSKKMKEAMVSENLSGVGFEPVLVV